MTVHVLVISILLKTFDLKICILLLQRNCESNLWKLDDYTKSLASFKDISFKAVLCSNSLIQLCGT